MLFATILWQLPRKKSRSPSYSIYIGPDYDDVGAIAMLHAFADSGEATILATMASNKNPPTAAVRGWEKYYTLNEGRFIINNDGSNAWNNNGKGHFHVVKKTPPNEMAALINQLTMHQPLRKVKR